MYNMVKKGLFQPIGGDFAKSVGADSPSLG
jgi:hypothetical protein